MYLLGINGSPKEMGLASSLLDKALEGARSSGAKVEKIILNKLNIKACQECGGCDVTGECLYADDMQAIYGKLDEADAVIVASPIYFGSVTAQLKTMIDRCHSRWISKYVLGRRPHAGKKRRGFFLCVAGRDNKVYFDNAKSIIKTFFITLDIEYSQDLFVGGLNAMPADSTQRSSAAEKAFQLGKAISDEVKV